MAPLISLADPDEPLVWVRSKGGSIAIGETLRVNFSGVDRFAHASAWWRDLTAAATIDDAVNVSGSGLIAFGTIAFDDASSAASTFIVPRLIISRDEDLAWVTEISNEPIDAQRLEAPHGLSQLRALAKPLRPWRGVELDTESHDAEYFAGVRAATELTRESEIEKIVIARRVSGEIDARDDLRIPLQRLADRYADCRTFAVDGLIGASPETLMRTTDGVVSARILAGTRGRHSDAAADARARQQLLTSEKEQHEHAYAVQSVITALGPHVSELESDAVPYALELPNVWHLATDLRAVPRQRGGVLDLAGAVHPTAAVAGTPTADAIAAITQLESFDRGRYAGTVGWIDGRGDGEWVIALRCAQLGPADGVGKRPITAYAGGGILADSDARHEFAETISKLKPVAEAFAH